MSTNYFLKDKTDAGSEPLHIGKSSVGWCFSLRVYPELLEEGVPAPKDLEDWEELFQDSRYVIEDQYGVEIPSSEMLDQIRNRKRTTNIVVPFGHVYRSMDEFYQINQAQPGPEGLIRHKIDGQHCVAHGEGTWDLIAREFC